MSTEQYPINYKFVTTQQINTIVNAEPKKLSVLVLDEVRNTKYWKVIYSFAEFIQSVGLQTPDDAKVWYISYRFTELDAFQDLVENIANSETLQIYGIPVEFVEHDEAFCVLELINGELKENNLWK